MARVKGGAARGVRWRAAGRVAGAPVLVTLLAGALAAPTLADGYAALQWTRHYAAGFGGERPQERVRQCGRWAARAIDALAPLPAAGEAATLGLQTGRQFEGERPAAVLVLYTDVRAALERQQASAWRGRGLTALVDEARALEQGARAAAFAAAANGTRPAVASVPPAPAPASTPSPLVTPSPSPSPSHSTSPRATPAAPRVPPQPKPSRRAKPQPRPTAWLSHGRPTQRVVPKTPCPFSVRGRRPSSVSSVAVWRRSLTRTGGGA